jgi:hypothetical protein
MAKRRVRHSTRKRLHDKSPVEDGFGRGFSIFNSGSNGCVRCSEPLRQTPAPHCVARGANRSNYRSSHPLDGLRQIQSSFTPESRSGRIAEAATMLSAAPNPVAASIWKAARLYPGLLANTQLADHVAVAVRVRLLQIIQKSAALRHQHQQATARAMIFLVGLEMFRQFPNAL